MLILSLAAALHPLFFLVILISVCCFFQEEIYEYENNSNSNSTMKKNSELAWSKNFVYVWKNRDIKKFLERIDKNVAMFKMFEKCGFARSVNYKWGLKIFSLDCTEIFNLIHSVMQIVLTAKFRFFLKITWNVVHEVKILA